MGFACINTEGQACEGMLTSTTGLGQAPGRVSLGQSWTLATMSGSTAALQVYHPTLPVLPSFLAAHFLKILSYRVWRRTGLTVAGDCYPRVHPSVIVESILSRRPFIFLGTRHIVYLRTGF